MNNYQPTFQRCGNTVLYKSVYCYQAIKHFTVFTCNIFTISRQHNLQLPMLVLRTQPQALYKLWYSGCILCVIQSFCNVLEEYSASIFVVTKHGSWKFFRIQSPWWNGSLVHPQVITKQLYYTHGQTTVLSLRMAVRVPNDSNHGVCPQERQPQPRTVETPSTTSQTGGEIAQGEARTRRRLHRKV